MNHGVLLIRLLYKKIILDLRKTRGFIWLSNFDNFFSFLKVLQYLDSIKYNLAALNAFAKVVKITN